MQRPSPRFTQGSPTRASATTGPTRTGWRGISRKCSWPSFGLKKVKADADVVAKVERYLHRAVAQAKVMLPEHVPTLGSLGDCFTGGNDSDND